MSAIYLDNDGYYRSIAFLTSIYRIPKQGRLAARRKHTRKHFGEIDALAASLTAQNNRYHAIMSALDVMEHDPWTGRIEECQVKIVLGEIGDIWPEHIRELTQAS